MNQTYITQSKVCSDDVLLRVFQMFRISNGSDFVEPVVNKFGQIPRQMIVQRS